VRGYPLAPIDDYVTMLRYRAPEEALRYIATRLIACQAVLSEAVSLRRR
jgi:hypothetical protein